VEGALNGLITFRRRALKLPAGAIRKRNEDRLVSAKSYRIDVNSVKLICFIGSLRVSRQPPNRFRLRTKAALSQAASSFSSFFRSKGALFSIVQEFFV
jgi:hypothetical protein